MDNRAAHLRQVQKDTMTKAIDFPSLIPKFDAILARGLCSGLGDRDGQMCIEAAICAALGLPHSDNPNCVASAVRSYKIALNDATWPSPEARAKGLRALGIAQIGSKGVVDDVEFTKRLAEKTIRVLIPALFREVLTDSPQCMEAADACEREGRAASAERAASAAASAASAERAASAAASAAWAAASAVVWAARAAESAAWAEWAASADYLHLSASLALEVLRELKSPGCEYV